MRYCTLGNNYYKNLENQNYSYSTGNCMLNACSLKLQKFKFAALTNPWRRWKQNVRTRSVYTFCVGNEVKYDLWPWPQYEMRSQGSPMLTQIMCALLTYVSLFHIKVKVKCHHQGHYPAKLLKCFQIVQNVFAFFLAQCLSFNVRNEIIT